MKFLALKCQKLQSICCAELFVEFDVYLCHCVICSARTIKVHAVIRLFIYYVVLKNTLFTRCKS